MIANVIKHMNKIFVHKFWVGYYCFKAGLYYQGLVHDLSKFSLTEFIESAKYYQGNRSPIKVCKEEKGYSEAWLHHKARNKHHYQYWTDDFDKYHTDKGLTLIKMPFKYALEMICDYLGAARAYEGKNFSYKKEYQWWLATKKDNCAMHEDTKAFVDFVLKQMAIKESDDILHDTSFLKNVYCEEYDDDDD